MRDLLILIIGAVVGAVCALIFYSNGPQFPFELHIRAHDESKAINWCRTQSYCQDIIIIWED